MSEDDVSPSLTNSLNHHRPGSGQPKPKINIGRGGEIHQDVPADSDHGDGAAHLTDNFGHRISDNQNSLRAGERGPTLLEDFVLREKIFHFDHERIPERIVHARGSGAHGVFECTKAIPELTKASIFQKKGNSCPLFVRFSTVAGGAGSIDTPRDVRGFAVKLYTDSGNWDLVGNNIPVFFIQDAMKFPDLVHSVKMEADRGYPQAASAHDTFWDFISLMPESMHMIMWAMSDRAIPRSLRMMEGFGVNTFRFVNANGEGRFVKFHWKPVLGIVSTTWDEAVKIAGADPDFHRRDLFEAIDAGDYPQWDLGVQVFDEDWAAQQHYDVLDATKLIPEEDIPVEIIGRMTLDRNVDNFFAETEQAAFLPSNIIPGIDFSNDPLLQGRLFSYLDTQKSRLGTTNFHQIPINAPKCPFHNFQRDGMMQTLVPTGRANYEPNSLAEAGEDGGPRACPEIGFTSFTANDERNEPAHKLRIRAELFADHYSQARLFFRSQTENEQAHTGVKTWRWRGIVLGVRRKVTLGRYPVHSLADARKWANEIARARDNGVDLTARKADERSSEQGGSRRTCDWLFALYMENEGNQRRSASEKRRLYNRDIKPILGHRLVDDIRHNDLADIMQSKLSTAPIVSNALQSLMKRWFRWSITKGRHLTGVEYDPARDLAKLAPASARSRHLDRYEIGVCLEVLLRRSDRFSDPLRLILYTGVRKSEAFEMEWRELDLETGNWLIPAARTKNSQEHLLPLSAEMVEMLASLPRTPGQRLVWPGGGKADRPMSGFTRAIQRAQNEMDKIARTEGRAIAHWAIHDLRRTVVTGMNGLLDINDQPRISPAVVEQVVNHKIGGVRGVYNRHFYYAEKKAALRIWADHLHDLGASRLGSRVRNPEV